MFLNSPPIDYFQNFQDFFYNLILYQTFFRAYNSSSSLLFHLLFLTLYFYFVYLFAFYALHIYFLILSLNSYFFKYSLDYATS